mmetsp:Transcript_38359/g.70395  ORF Transcript_38359/g.70395 Transcript_38359/m.70395 type:complete len:228 (+) Transcript_38359:722-1405(+)
MWVQEDDTLQKAEASVHESPACPEVRRRWVGDSRWVFVLCVGLCSVLVLVENAGGGGADVPFIIDVSFALLFPSSSLLIIGDVNSGVDSDDGNEIISKSTSSLSPLGKAKTTTTSHSTQTVNPLPLSSAAINAYSNCNNRPSGEKVVMLRSYLSAARVLGVPRTRRAESDRAALVLCCWVNSSSRLRSRDDRDILQRGKRLSSILRVEICSSLVLCNDASYRRFDGD